jgi:hypothetical protein
MAATRRSGNPSAATAPTMTAAFPQPEGSARPRSHVCAGSINYPPRNEAKLGYTNK